MWKALACSASSGTSPRLGTALFGPPALLGHPCGGFFSLHTVGMSLPATYLHHLPSFFCAAPSSPSALINYSLTYKQGPALGEAHVDRGSRGRAGLCYEGQIRPDHPPGVCDPEKKGYAKSLHVLQLRGRRSGRGGCFSLEKSRVPCWRRLKTVFIQLLTAALNRFALDRPGSHRGTGGGRQKGFNKEAIL